MSEKIVNVCQFTLCNIPIWNNMFGAKVYFGCGECGFSQKTRIPITDNPIVECKHCKTLNRIPLITYYPQQETKISSNKKNDYNDYILGGLNHNPLLWHESQMQLVSNKDLQQLPPKISKLALQYVNKELDGFNKES